MLVKIYFVRPFEISAGEEKDEIIVYMDKNIFMVEDVWGLHYDWVEPVTEEALTEEEQAEAEANSRRLARYKRRKHKNKQTKSQLELRRRKNVYLEDLWKVDPSLA